MGLFGLTRRLNRRRSRLFRLCALYGTIGPDLLLLSSDALPKPGNLRVSYFRIGLDFVQSVAVRLLRWQTYMPRLTQPRCIRVTRLARPIPAGRFRTPCRVQLGDTADYKSALRTGSSQLLSAAESSGNFTGNRL